MIVIILTLFLGVLVFIALLRFRNVDEEKSAERGTERNDSAGIEKYENQWNLNQRSSITGNISMEQNLPDQVKQENEDQRYVNGRILDVTRSNDDSNGPINQDNIGKENLNDEEFHGILLEHDQILIAEAVNKERESTKFTKDAEPECRDTEDRLLKVLTILNLTEKYPGRLSREDMFQITKGSLFDELPKCQEELASYFINKIARYDYTAREFCILRSENKQSSTFQTDPKSSYRQKMNKRAEERRELDVSPMDIIIAVFLCCDDMCRQDLVSHMWRCRLAIPLVIQEKAPPILPSCFLWPLQTLVMKWETQHNGNICMREGRLVKEFFSSVAFIRVGKIGLSKSALINNVISASEKTHSIFFHRNCPGSTKHRYLIDGLIDISWYFPTPKSEGKYTHHFKDAVTFLNLHGDACQFQNHLPALSKLANIITVLCKVEHLNRCRHVIQPCLDMGNTVLVILTDQEIQDDGDATIGYFAENIRAAKNQLEYLEVVDKQRAELVQETRCLLMKLVEGKYVCLDKACSSDINVIVDEKTDIFLNTKKEALAISTLLRKTPYKERKNSFLPLQGEPWITWAAADKERIRTTCKQKNEDFQIYVAGRVKAMKRCRLQQLEILKRGEKRGLVDIFLNSVSISNSKRRNIFLRWLQFEIDDLSREDLTPVYENYHNSMQQFIIAEETVKKNLKSRIVDLDNEIALRTFGLEHIMREIGQIYEALHAEGFQHSLLKHDLPELAAKILLDGYPLELFDGSVNAVPIQWVTDIFKNLDNILEKKHKTVVRMKVITVLGIQSSGKSTMLNALFGCQDAVSAGRCTRGAYCHLIKVEETYSKELGIDYVLAVETEGLRAPELSASGQMVTHDNEHFTFVIGLGDLIILNVMGANTTYLDDLLTISVYAFLRMEMTTYSRPKCIIVHQNVNMKDVQQLLYQGRMLEDSLDKMTKMACKVERTEPKSFKDIIEFDVRKDVYFLPALLEGSEPLAPISRRYSEELNFLKQSLVTKALLRKPSKTLASFINHLQNLWSAIKQDDFVFQFRNTIEMEARSKLDEYWCEANWKFRQPVHNIMSTGYIQIQNTKDIFELERLVKTLEIKLREAIANERSRQKNAFSTFISEADTLMNETMMKQKVDMDKRFYDLSNELLREITEKLREFKRDRRRKFSLKDDKLRYKDTLRKSIEQLVQSVKLPELNTITEAEILTIFDDNWIVWKSNILEEAPICQAPINIEEDAFDALSRAFSSATDALQHYMQVKSLSRYDLRDFKSEVLLTKVQCWTAKIGLSPKKQVKDLAESLFCKVKAKLESREGLLRPYSQQDIEEIVQDVKDHFHENGKFILLKPKHEVYLAVIVCGHAIKRLQRIHEKCEIRNSLGNLLEKEKMHYLRIFTSLYNKDETVNLLAVHCQEILMKGILHKMTHTLPDKIELDLRRRPFMLTSKTVVIYDLMINLARDASYENFKLFIRDPLRSITIYICSRIEQYAQQKEKPLEEKFVTTLNAIEDDVWQALQKSFATGRSDFKIWLETFRRETKDLIVLENIDRLHELGDDRAFALEIFFERVSHCLKSVIQEINSEMCSYLAENHELIKNEVMKRILKYIIGCTKGCPFCGAICMVAHPGHDGEHYTTLHRPQGCKGRYYEGTKILVMNTCSESVSSPEMQFIYYKNGVENSCYYRDYKTVYPEWKITADATGDETSFWNFFFAEYAEKLSVDGLNVPVIPLSWRELNCKTEIKKLEEKMNK